MQEDDYERPRGRHILFGLAFLALFIIGVWTVMIPALEDAPSEEEAEPESGAEEEASPGAPE